MGDEPFEEITGAVGPAPASDGARKIYEAQSSWIEKADVKASIILTLESAILKFVTVLSTNG
jgi:hypothetical protein